MDDMAISARNRLPGRVTKVTSGEVSSEVVLAVGPDVELVSVITQGSIERLGITAGVQVLALVKATSVLLSVGAEPPAVSTRNRISGVVSAVHEGDTTAEVTVKAGDGFELTSMVTLGSVERLGFKPGLAVCALVKASSVLLACP